MSGKHYLRAHLSDPGFQGMTSNPKLPSSSSKTDDESSGSSAFLSRMKPPSIVYWTRIGFAILAGVIYNLGGLGTQGVAIGTIGVIGIGVLVYAAHVMTVRYLFGFGETELTGPRKHVSIGMGSYIAWFVFTTILLNTILHPALT